jgi:hypothetical protein
MCCHCDRRTRCTIHLPLSLIRSLILEYVQFLFRLWSLTMAWNTLIQLTTLDSIQRQIQMLQFMFERAKWVLITSFFSVVIKLPFSHPLLNACEYIRKSILPDTAPGYRWATITFVCYHWAALTLMAWKDGKVYCAPDHVWICNSETDAVSR